MTDYQKLLRDYAEADRRRTTRDIRAVLGTAEGRRLLVALQGLTGIYAPAQLEHLEYQAGRRNAGLEILAVCNEAAREMVLLAQAERNAEIEERNVALKAAAYNDEGKDKPKWQANK